MGGIRIDRNNTFAIIAYKNALTFLEKAFIIKKIKIEDIHDER